MGWILAAMLAGWLLMPSETPAAPAPQKKKGPRPRQFFYPGKGWLWLQDAPPGARPSHYCQPNGRIVAIPPKIQPRLQQQIPPPPPPPEPPGAMVQLKATTDLSATPTMQRSSLDYSSNDQTLLQPALFASLDFDPPEVKAQSVDSLDAIHNETLARFSQYGITPIHVDLLYILAQAGLQSSLDSFPYTVTRLAWIAQVFNTTQELIKAGWRPDRKYGPEDPAYVGVVSYVLNLIKGFKGGLVGGILNAVQTWITDIINLATEGARIQEKARQNLYLLLRYPQPPNIAVLRWLWSYASPYFLTQHGLTYHVDGLDKDRPTLVDILLFYKAEYPAPKVPLLPPRLMLALQDLFLDGYRQQSHLNDLSEWYMITGDWIASTEREKRDLDNLLARLDTLKDAGILHQPERFAPQPNPEILPWVRGVADRIYNWKDPFWLAWFDAEKKKASQRYIAF